MPFGHEFEKRLQRRAIRDRPAAKPCPHVPRITSGWVKYRSKIAIGKQAKGLPVSCRPGVRGGWSAMLAASICLGLPASAFAETASQQGWDIEAVLNNDIVGGNKDPQQDTSVVRVFSEGVPVAATDQQLRTIRMLGGESDSASRELARYIAEVGRTYDAGIKPMLIFRLDRYLRGGDHYSFNQQGFAAVRFTEFRENLPIGEVTS